MALAWDTGEDVFERVAWTKARMASTVKSPHACRATRRGGGGAASAADEGKSGGGGGHARINSTIDGASSVLVRVVSVPWVESPSGAGKDLHLSLSDVR